MELSADKSVREILRLRPRSIEVLEIVAGGGFWNYLDRPFHEFCREKDLKPHTLLHSISTLPRVSETRDWREAPIYDLVDLLVDDHRWFKERDIPGIEQRLAECDASDFPPGFSYEDFRLRFHSFKVDFLLHMNEEEEYFFPMALRTEACLRHPELPPETFRGSVSDYSSSMLRMPEQELKQTLEMLRRKVADQAGPSTPALERIRDRVEDLDSRACRHADLECEVLLPRVLAIERKLNRRLENPGDRLPETFCG